MKDTTTTQSIDTLDELFKDQLRLLGRLLLTLRNMTSLAKPARPPELVLEIADETNDQVAATD